MDGMSNVVPDRLQFLDRKQMLKVGKVQMLDKGKRLGMDRYRESILRLL